MTDIRQRSGIRTGWDVYGSDGQHIGSVGEIGENYVLVQKGMIFVHDIFIPVSAIERVEDEAVWLNVAKADVDAMGWDMPPSEGSWEDWTGGTPRQGQTDRERIPVREEELEAHKTTRQAGEVQVRKDVVEEQRSMDVPVTREEVQVKRVPVDRPASGDETTIGKGDTVRVPVMEEDVEVTKRPRVKEEIEISKVARQKTKRATGTVRKEHVDVSQEGDARVIGSSDRDARTRTRRDVDDESGTEALGAGAGALGGAAIRGAVGGPPGAIVGGAVGAAAGGVAGEASEGDEEAGSGAGGAAGTVAGAAIGGAVAGPPGAVVGGAVGGGAGAGLGDQAQEEATDEDDDLRER